MKLKPFILATVLSLILIGCSDTNKDSLSGPNNNLNLPSNPAPIEGTYQYSGYDVDGNLQSSGTITIAITDTVISGQRDLIGNGFENGTGDISGVIDNTKITINLTPSSVAHFIIEGELRNGDISGDRLLDSGTSISVQNIGTFKAQKVSY